MTEFEILWQQAKDYYNSKDYENAKSSYKDLWENSDKNNHNIFAEYGNALRKNGEPLEFIKLFNELDKKSYLRSNSYVHSVLCWCIYDEYIKKYDSSDIDHFPNFLKLANFITNHCSQKTADEEPKTPYVPTIKKVVKVYNDKASTKNSRKNQEEIINWLNKLDPSNLSEKCFNFCDEKGNKRELASSKEFYYQNMIKALEKTEQYEECIKKSDTALEEIKSFHYRNRTWIEARKNFSKCMISENIDEAIKDYENMAEREKYWFMWHKLSQICYRFGKMKESLLYSSKALVQDFQYESMVNLFYNLGLEWQANGDVENAKIFFQACAYYRTIQGWYISEDLQFYIKEFELDVNKKPSKKLLQDISKKYVDENVTSSYEFGMVKRVLSHGGSGFIISDCGKGDIYFNMKSVKNRKTVVENQKVKYERTTAKDGRDIAIDIEGV